MNGHPNQCLLRRPDVLERLAIYGSEPFASTLHRGRLGASLEALPKSSGWVDATA